MFLKQSLTKIAFNILGLANSYPTELTSKAELVELIQKLYPKKTDVELIRLGSKNDGGYLISNDLSGIEACFSPGVSNISEFEKDCADLGLQIFLADRSVDGPSIEHERFNFIKKYIGANTSTDFITIDDWVNSSIPNSKSDLMLQIDIEGYEYETFLSISNNLMNRFRIIVGEFHNFDQIWNRAFFKLASHAFYKILQTHSCVHIHPNNCCGSLTKYGLKIPQIMEFTFLRNDRIINSSFANIFPHPLDSDNYSKPHMSLPKCWYHV